MALLLVSAALLAPALGANYWIYDGGVRRQADTTLTNTTYAPSVGGGFVGGDGVVLSDQGYGLHAEGVSAAVGAVPPVHRPICIYGDGGSVGGCSTR